MKNKLLLLLLVISSFCFFPKDIFAVDYSKLKKDESGNYSVNNAVCYYNVKNTEEYPDIGILVPSVTIKFKNEKLSSFEGNTGAYKIYAGSVSYTHFFSNKEFKCKDVLGLRFARMPDLSRDKHGQNYYVDLATCDSADCYKLVLDKSKSKVVYNELKEGETNSSVTGKSVCSFTKTSSNSSGSNDQKNSPSKLNYTEYSDGTSAFVTEDNVKVPISSGSISDCSTTETLYLKMHIVGDKLNSYSIVNSCNENFSTDCVVYLRSNITYSSVDSGIKEDGSSSNESTSSTPSEVGSILDFSMENEEECSSYLGSIAKSTDPAYYLHFAFNLMKYAAILILFALTVVDFFQSATSDKEDSIKKAFYKAIKRLIIVVIIFFIPIIVEFIFELFGIITDPSCLTK